MLRTFRKNAQSWMIKGVLWLVVAAFIGTIFLVWGRGGDVAQSDMAAIVNDRVITMSQYYNEYQNLEQVYREIYGNLVDTNSIDSETLKREALDNLINRELFREAAEKFKIMVTAEEVQSAIAQTPAFFENGQFNRERYLTILRTNGITPKDYEGQMKLDIKLKKLQSFISGTVKISEKEVKDRYVTLRREVKLNYLSIDPAELNVEPPSMMDMAGYYADNKESFRVPAKVTVEYGIFTSDHFIDKITVTDAEIRTYYEANPEKFLAPEKRRFHEIVLPYRNSQERDENLQKARKIREEIVSGEMTFKEGIQKYSQTKGSGENQQTRWYEEKDLPREMANSVFSLPVDSVTEPADSGKEVKILKVAEIKRSDPYPIEEVRERVIKDLKVEKSQDFAIIKAYEAKGRIAKGEGYKEVLEDYGVPITTSKLVSHDEVEPALKNVISSSYLLTSGEVGEVKKSGKNHIVFRVIEKKDSTIKSLEEAKKEIKTIIEQKKKHQKALSVAGKIIAAAKKEGGLKKAAGTYSLPLKTTPYFSPVLSQGVPGIALSGVVIDSVLSLGKTNRISEKPLTSGEKIYAFEFAGEKELSMKGYDEEKRQIEGIMFEQKKTAALQAFLSDQREKSNIEISDDLNIKPAEPL